MGGSSALKNETRRLTSGLSYLEAALPLDKPIRKMRDMRYDIILFLFVHSNGAISTLIFLSDFHLI